MSKKMRTVDEDDDEEDGDEDEDGDAAVSSTTTATKAATKKKAKTTKKKKDAASKSSNQVQRQTAAVDVNELSPGGLYVHKDFGKCIFLGVETHPDKRRNNRPAPFVMLRFADGLAKLPARQLKRHIYRAKGDDADAAQMAATNQNQDGDNSSSTTTTAAAAAAAAAAEPSQALTLKPTRMMKSPRLGKLKDPSAWRRTMQRSKRTIDGQVSKLMDTLIKRLQVTRPQYEDVSTMTQRTDGTPMDGAGILQAFNESFGYDLTPDQKSAVEDVVSDMTLEPFPMDRLVIGDVGYGKTEVAVRAVFTAAMSDRQVFVLAPTTVLATQHYKLLKRRFEGVLSKDGVDIGESMGLLCRFTKAGERRKLLERIAKGEQLVTVGTHALLSDKVESRHLNLLVVDEEQRFGVKQKERLRSARSEVDVLTLTATPIPRTLQWATLSLRQTSCIFTPPPARKPIETVVAEFDEEQVYDAISREVGRGGQVYFVVPRIEPDMDDAVRYIKRGVVAGKLPGTISWGTINGSMKPTAMEAVMTSFGDREFDILIATSIVESGLDMPNVNTIIIPNAHYFGIASLYQLRGRVGRSDIEARAYLMYPRQVALKLVENGPAFDILTYRRIEALRECCNGLGLGYRLAERDAEIRGMGELMGLSQTDGGGRGKSGGGNAASLIGPDLYVEQVFDALQKVEQQYLPTVENGPAGISFALWCAGALEASYASLPRGECTWPVAELSDASVAKLEDMLKSTMLSGDGGAFAVDRMYRAICMKYQVELDEDFDDPLAPRSSMDDRVANFVQLLMIRSLCSELGIHAVAGGYGVSAMSPLPPPLTGFDTEDDVWLLTKMNQETYDMVMMAPNAEDGGAAMDSTIRTMRNVTGVVVKLHLGDVEEGGGAIVLRGLGAMRDDVQISTVCELLMRMREGLPEYVAYL